MARNRFFRGLQESLLRPNCADYPSRGLWSKLKQLVGEFVLDEAFCFITSQRLNTLPEHDANVEEHGDDSEKNH